MDGSPVDFAGERLVRTAPDWPMVLEPADRDYVLGAFAALRAAFPAGVPADPPLDLMSGRALMRLLIDLRRQLRPADHDQRAALGWLAGAILILDAACSFAREHDRVRARRTQPVPDPDQSSS